MTRLMRWFWAAAAASPLLYWGEPLLAQSDLARVVEAWLKSPHADTSAEAFIHWDEEGAVPESCAVCHAGVGLLDFVGADGSPAGRIEGPAPVQSPVSCAACHAPEAELLDRVTFPSGVTVEQSGPNTVCMVCHMGRESGDSLGDPFAGRDSDGILTNQSFVNIHYAASAATLYGAETRAGYQYPHKSYSGRFTHVSGYDNCAGCHEPHSTEVREEECASCHQTGDSVAMLKGQIASAHAALARAIVDYAVAGGYPIAYSASAYPYFFEDLDADGNIGPEEARFPNRYAHWTPRLLRAAYNYQLVEKDPGAYAHNPRYALQLLIDSLESLGERVAVPDDLGPRPLNSPWSLR
jgi:hypothetical protein